MDFIGQFIKKNNRDMTKCKQCGYSLTSFSQKFYCCDKQQLVCSFCRRVTCPKCKKPRTIQLKRPQCAKCLNRLQQNELFLDKNCGKQYCSRCLVSTFKYEYQKMINSSENYQQGNKLLAKLPCGDNCKFNDLLQFFSHFCIECGKDELKGINYELKDGVKLCYFCYNYFKDKYFKAFIVCISCGRQIQSYLKAGLADQQGMILCRQCVHQSQIEEIQLEKTKELNQSRKISQSIHVEEKKSVCKEENVYREKKFVSESSQRQRKDQKIQKVSEEKIDFSGKKILKNTQVRSEEKEERKSQENFQVGNSQKKQEFFKPQHEQEFQESQKKQELFESKRSSNQKLPLSSYSVTSSLQQDMQEADEELRVSLGLKEKPLLKKHLSGETMVEQLQLKVPINKDEELVNCKECNIQVSKKVAFDLFRSSEQKKKSSTLISISSLEASIVSENSQKAQYICRVCFSKSCYREKLLLDKRQPLKTSFMPRNSQVRESQQNVNYLKVSNASNQQSRSPSSSSNKEYGLTGAKPTIMDKPSILDKLSNLGKTSTFDADSRKSLPKKEETIPIRGKTPVKPVAQTIKLNLSDYSGGISSSQRDVKRCKLCGQANKRLILSYSQGYYCQACYYTVMPSSISRAARFIY